MSPLQAIIAALVILILVLGFFAFHVLVRFYIWPETYRKREEEDTGHHQGVEMQGGSTPGGKEVVRKTQKKFKPPKTRGRG